MKDFKLENEPKIESGFKTPDGYFENFVDKILQKLPEDELKVISIFQKRKILVWIAAAMFILTISIPLINMFSVKTEELKPIDIENYLAYQSNVNQYDLILDLEPEEINNIKTTVALEDEMIEDILATNSNIIQLIID